MVKDHAMPPVAGSQAQASTQPAWSDPFEAPGAFLPPSRPNWVPELRQPALLAELDRHGYRLVLTANGPREGFELRGPRELMSSLPPELRARIAAVRDDLMEDVRTRRQVAESIRQAIDGAEVWDDLHTAHSHLRCAWDCGTLPAHEVSRLSRYLADRSRSVPCTWDQVAIDRYLGRHENRLLMVSRRVARQESQRHRVRRFGADGTTRTEEVQGELVGIVPGRHDVPPDRETAVPRVVWYTLDELAIISRLPPEQVRAVHAVKEGFDGEVMA